MGRAGDEGERVPMPDASRARARPDRLAEALRANLKRRKAQARARDDGRPDETATDDRAPERHG